MLRCPILCVLGHVDSGKTSILDSIRETKVGAREVGGITQSIGASEIPVSVINARCGVLLERMKINFTIPGLLVIDTPGHEVFSNLRKRGGSVADIAILVVDVNRGIEAQTLEAMQILREHKTPFVIALNKIDALSGWKRSTACFVDSIGQQRPDVAEELDKRIYSLIGELYNRGFNAERFDRVTDFTKQILIVPVSARTRDGLQELLMSVAGLAQRFLEKSLEMHDERGKGSILEVKEEKGLGKTLDVILYDGIIRVGDEIVFASQDAAIASKVKALLKPKPLDDMRDPQQKFTSVENAVAACGVKIACDEADKAVAGSSLFVVGEGREEELKNAIEGELKEIIAEHEGSGIILKADSLGSLEAIESMLAKEKIPLKRAAIGNVSKGDVTEAAAIKENEKLLGVVMAFNVSVPEDASAEAERNGVKLFDEKIIYNLVEGYKRWVDEEKAKEKKEAFASLTLPAKILVLQGFCFHASNPCIFGVEVVAGRIRKDYKMMNAEGGKVGVIKAIQKEKESAEEAKKGEQVAISMSEPAYGRQVFEKQELYSDISREEVKAIEEKYLQALSAEEKALLEEIKKIKGFVFFGS